MPKAGLSIWGAILGLAIGGWWVDGRNIDRIGKVQSFANLISMDAGLARNECQKNAADIRYLMDHTAHIQMLQAQVSELNQRLARVERCIPSEPPDDPPPGSENDPAYKAEIIEMDGKLILQPAPAFRDQWKKRTEQ